MRVCCIEKEKWLVYLILRCYWDNKKQKSNLKNCNRLMIKNNTLFIKLRTAGPEFVIKDYFQQIHDAAFVNPADKHSNLTLDKVDKQLIKSIKICSFQGYANILFLGEEILIDVDNFFSRLDILTHKEIFCSDVASDDEMTEEKIKERIFFGKWFQPTSSNSLSQIYVAFLERAICKK